MHSHWGAASKILNTLQGQGKIAWLAGGCVRDALLGRNFTDLDIVTDATPDEIVQFFTKTIPVGINFGVVNVVEDGVSLEVATLRTDGSYKDGRRPESVEWATPEGDAERRDFTVNALFYDPVKKTVIDYVGGRRDLSAKVIRAVGEPLKRFEEDKLRLLRAIRFVAQLGFSIEENTWAAIVKMSEEFQGVSFERIYQEWIKILKSKDPTESLRLLFESGLGEKIFPEVSKASAKKNILLFHELNLAHPAGRMMALFQELSVKELSSLLDRMKYPKKESKQILDEYRFYQDWKSKPEFTFKTLQLFDRCRAEAVTPLLSTYGIAKFTDFYLSLCDQAGSLPKPLLDGESAIRQGLKPGPEMGRWLEQAYEYQVMNRIETSEQLLKELAPNK